MSEPSKITRSTIAQIRRGDPEVFEKFEELRPDHTRGELIRVVVDVFCKNGEFALAHRVLVTIEATFEDLEPHNEEIFKHSVKNDCEILLQWMYKKFGDKQVKDDMAIFIIAEECCAQNALNVFKWIFRTFEQVKKSEYIEVCCLVACVTGNMHIAKWICSKAPIAASEETPHFAETFSTLCRWGDFEDVKWFYNTFLIKEDLEFRNFVCLQNICLQGRVKLARWIGSKIEPARTHKKIPVNILMMAAQKSGSAQMRAWVRDTFC